MLREASSSWALLVAVCYQKWELEAGNGESVPGRRSPAQEDWLQDRGDRKRRCLPHLGVSPAPSTAITTHRSPRDYLPSPPPSSQSFKLRSNKSVTGTKFFIIRVFCQYFFQAVARLLILLTVSFEKHMFVILMMLNISVFFLCHSCFFNPKKSQPNPNSKPHSFPKIQ